jgi:hypothetical protein
MIMTTHPSLITQMASLHKEIAELRLLQKYHESLSRLTDDERLHMAHLRVASQLDELVFELENNLLPALESTLRKHRE